MFNKTWRSFLLVTGETLLLVAAVVISSIVIGGPQAWDLVTDNTAFLRVLLIVMVCQVCLHYTDLYDLRTIHGKRDLVHRLMRAIGGVSTTTQSNDSFASSSSCFIAGDTSRLIGSGSIRPEVSTQRCGVTCWTGSLPSVGSARLSVSPCVDGSANISRMRGRRRSASISSTRR